MSLGRINIQNEIQLKENEGCIIFDLGCYFPYQNTEILTFEFLINSKPISDVKMNHRYPNHNYQTLSRTYGRKVSKIGYPHFISLDQQEPLNLTIKIGIKDKVITLNFPIETKLTKEQPVCVLSLHYNFDEYKIRFESLQYQKEEHCYYQYIWTNDEELQKGRPYTTLFTIPIKSATDSHALYFTEVLTPFASELEHLL